MEINKARQTEKRVVFIIAMMAAFLPTFVMSTSNIALPTIGEYFKMDAVTLGWVATVNILASALFLVPFGRLADLHGRKMVFTWGIVIYTLSSLLLGFAPSTGIFIALRVLQGIGSSAIFGTSTAILLEVYSPQERGKILGIQTAIVYVGLSVGPYIGGLLTTYIGWQWVFWVNVPLGLIIIVAILWKLKGEWAGARGEGYDMAGTLVYCPSLVAIVYGLSLLPQIIGYPVIAAGLIGIIIFVQMEKKKKSPVMDVGMFRNRVFAFSSAAAFINYAATSAISFLLSLYLQYIHALPPQDAGLVLLVMPVAQAIISPISGRLSDKIPAQRLAAVGIGLNAVGLFMFIFLGEGTPVWYIMMVLVILGIGFGTFVPPNTNALMGTVEKKFYGVATGVISTMRLTGQMFSMSIAMLLFSIFIGRVQIGPAQYPGLIQASRVGFIIFTLMCILGVLASLASEKSRVKIAAVSVTPGH